MSTQRFTSTHSSPADPWLKRTLASPWAPLPIVLAGTFMVVLDFFLVNVALPSMQSDLHAGSGSIQWVVAGYALTSAVFLISAARLGDQVGHRRVFSMGIGLFSLSSAVCGLASSSTVLVAGRLLQGAAAAAVMPNVLSIIGVNYGGRDRARAFGVYGLVMGVAAMGGQLIGGALVQADIAGLGWRSCFLINVPVGAIALVLAPRLVPQSDAKGSARLDLIGTALITIAGTAFVLPLLQGRQEGWPAWVWLSLAASPLCLLAFGLHQRGLARRGGQPLLQPALFRARSYRVGLLAQLAFWCGQASFFLVLALYLQQGRGLDALNAGLVFTILAVSYVVLSARAPVLLERHGRSLLGMGALVLAGGHGLLLLAVAEVGVGSSILALVPGLLLVGAGMGLMIVPLTTTIMAETGSQDAGTASGALAMMQNMGGALGVAVTGAIFFGTLHRGYAAAFELSLAQLAALLVAVAALTRLLPKAEGAT